jgi:hypothetical protein
MKESILAQIMQLEKMSFKELRDKYKELFGDTVLAQNNKVFLFKRIAHRIQELEYGGVSEITKHKIKELIEEHDPLNDLGKKKKLVVENNAVPTGRDRRLPLPGTIITKHYKGVVLQVKVLEKGFEYESVFYKSLSKIAK